VAKCSKVQKEIRINKLYELERSGLSRMQLIEYARKEWGIGRSQVDRYKKEINDTMTKEFSVSRKEMKVKLADAYMRTYKESNSSNQLAVSLGSLNALAKLFGLADEFK
tara:strand:+ start:35 stop:361 length:327 start_codon:yes stop_codon:yes gene_type:complete